MTLLTVLIRALLVVSNTSSSASLGRKEEFNRRCRFGVDFWNERKGRDAAGCQASTEARGWKTECSPGGP